MPGNKNEVWHSQESIRIGLSPRIVGEPLVPSSKYYTLRYIIAAMLADGSSSIAYPAISDDSEALFHGCRAFGAELTWLDEQQQLLCVHGINAAHVREREPVTINVGNAGAVLRVLLGLGALLPTVTFITDHPQSLGRRPNRELLQALNTLGVTCEANGVEGCLPITLHGGKLHGGHLAISGARSSQYLSALLFLAPLLTEAVTIEVIDELKSQPLVNATLEVLQEAGIYVEHDAALRHFTIAAAQHYQPRAYRIPGDYPSAATWLALGAVTTDRQSRVSLTRLREGDEVGELLLSTLHQMGAEIRREGETLTVYGGHPLRGVSVNGDRMIDCIPVLVAAACFAEGESVFYNVESLHYKESDRINDLCIELQRAGCDVTPQRDAIIVRGRPQGIAGGVEVDGHSDHRLLMALAIAGIRSQRGLTLTGVEHISKSYPHFFEELQRLGASVTCQRIA